MGDHQNAPTQEEDQLCYIDRFDVNELIGGVEQNEGDAQCNEGSDVCKYEIPFFLCNGENNREDSERNSSVSYLDDGASTIISKQDEDNGTEEDPVGKKKTKKKQTIKTKGKGKGKNTQTAKEKINIIFIPNDGRGLDSFEEILSMKNVSSEKVEKKLNEKVYQIFCKSVADINTHNLSKARKGSERQRRGTLHVEHIDYGDIFLSIRDSMTRRERRSSNNLLRDDSRRQLRRYTNGEDHQQALLGRRKVKNAYNYRCNGGNFFKSYRKKDTRYCLPIGGDRVIEKGASHVRRRRVAASHNHHVAANKRRNYVPLEDRKFLPNCYMTENGKKQNGMYSPGDYEEKKGPPFPGEKIAPNSVFIHSGRSPRGTDVTPQEGQTNRIRAATQEEIHHCEQQYYPSRRDNGEVAPHKGSAPAVLEISQRDKQPGEGATSECEINFAFDSRGEEKHDGEAEAGNAPVVNAPEVNDADVAKEGEKKDSTSPPMHSHHVEAKEKIAPDDGDASEMCHWREEASACAESVVSLGSLKQSGGHGGSNPCLYSREDKEYFDLLVRRYEKTKLSLEGSEVLSVSVSDAPGGEAAVIEAREVGEVEEAEVMQVVEEAGEANEILLGEPKPEDRASQIDAEEGEDAPTGEPPMDKAPTDENLQIGRYEELLENDMCDLYNLKMHDLKTLKKCDFGLSKNLLIKDIFMYHSNGLKEDEGPLDVDGMEDAQGGNEEPVDEDDGEIKSFLAKLKADVTSQIGMNNEDGEQAFDLLDSVHANDCYYDCDGGEEDVRGRDLFEDDPHDGEDFPMGSKLNLSDLDDDVGGGTAGVAIGVGMDPAVEETPPGGGSLFESPTKLEEERKDTECQTEFPLDFSRNTNRTPRKKSVEVILVKKKLKRMKEKDEEGEDEGQNKWGVSQTDSKGKCRRYPRRNRIKTLRYWIGERELTKRNPHTGEIDVVGFSECTNLGDLSPHIIGPIKYKTLNLRDMMYPLSADDEEGGHRRGSDSVDDASGDGLAGFHTDGQADGRVKTHVSDNRGGGQSRKRRRSEQKGALERDANAEEVVEEVAEEGEDDSERVGARLSSRSYNVSRRRRKRKFINIVNYIKKRRRKKAAKGVEKREGDSSEGNHTVGEDHNSGENHNAEENEDNLFHDASSWRFDEEVAGVEEAPGMEAPTEELPVEEVPGKEAPKEEAPIEEPPVEEPPVEELPVEELPVEELPVEEAPKEEAPREEPPIELPPVEAADQLVATEEGLEEGTKESAIEGEDEEAKGATKKKVSEKSKTEEKRKKDVKRKIKERRIDQMYKELSLFNLDFLSTGGKVKASKGEKKARRGAPGGKGAKKDITMGGKEGRKEKKQSKQEETQKEQTSGEPQSSENTACDEELNGPKVATILRTDEVGSTSGEEADGKVASEEISCTVEHDEKELPPSGDLLVEESPADSEGKPLFGEQPQYHQQGKDEADDVKTNEVISSNLCEVEEYTKRKVQSTANEAKSGSTAGEDEADVPVTTPQNDGAKLNHMKEERNDEGGKSERNKKIKMVPVEGGTEMADVRKDSSNEVPSCSRTDTHLQGEEKNGTALCVKSSRDYKTVLKKSLRVKVVHFDVDRRKQRRSKTGGADAMGEAADILHEVKIPQLLSLNSCIITGSPHLKEAFPPSGSLPLVQKNLFGDVKVDLSLYSVRMTPREKYSSSSLHHNLVGYVDAGERIKIVLGSQERCFERGDFFFIPRFRSFVVDNCSREECVVYVCPVGASIPATG
ncbi:schizont egress antigen-1, putative [Plasmodium vivax]|nr:schizont egress antigen-1, putative [Plasmodium vivax]